MNNNLLGNEKSIETDHLIIKGNIMTCENTMIQLSNISCISTYSLKGAGFPISSIVFIFIGLLLFKLALWLGLFLIIVGAFLIYAWYGDKEKKKKEIYLSILMNAGNTLRFMFNDKAFLEEVQLVLEHIIIDGGVGSSDIYIDIKDNTFSGNAQVLNDLHMQ